MTMSFFSEQQDKLVALLREERSVAEAKIEQQRQEAKAEAAGFRRELEMQRQEAKAEAVELRRELETQREESEAATRAWHRDQQIAVLQARLETLHGAQLLDEETLYLAEDAIADCKDLAADDKISRLTALSTKMTSDRAFARQLQRKKWL